jgi:hypothetical protein
MAERDNQTPRYELLARREEDHALAKRDDQRVEIYSRISKVIWGNRYQRRRLESAIELVETEHRFMEAVRRHQMAKGKLEAVFSEVAEEIAAARRRAENARIRDELEREDLMLRLKRLRKANAEFDGGEGDGSDRYERQLREAEQKTQFEAEMKATVARRAFKVRERLKQERDEMKAEVRKAVKGEPTAEQQRDLDDIEDFFQKLIDEVSP